MRARVAVVLLSALSLVTVVAWWTGGPRPASETSGPRYVTSSDCAACHGEISASHAASDHARALRVITDSTPLGDAPEIDGRAGRWLVEEGRVEWAATDSRARFPARYLVGVRPIVQIALEMPDGRLQVPTLGLVDDHWVPTVARESEAGSSLHWRGAAYSFEHRCVECHATGVSRPLVPGDSLRVDEPGVGCVACHGDARGHLTRGERMPSLGVSGAGFEIAIRPVARAGAPRDQAALEVCARCHSRRERIAPWPAAPTPLDAAFATESVAPPVYGIEGGLREEVFEHGSFAQSAMYAAGVGCVDCHDPHAGGLRAEGDALCLRCHDASLARTDHHGHALGGPGSRCVDCHMPQRTFLAVDVRHDHSFPIPRPDLRGLGAEDACARCHEAGDARITVTATLDPSADDRVRRRVTVMRAVEEGPRALLTHGERALALALDPSEPSVRRRAVLEALLPLDPALARCVGALLLRSADVELRLALTTAPALALELLGDASRAVRARAGATALLSGQGASLSRSLRDELRLAQRENGEQPAAHVRLALLAELEGDLAGALRSLATAMQLSARDDESARIETALFHERRGRLEDAERALAALHTEEGLEAYILHLVRRRRHGEAEALLVSALQRPAPSTRLRVLGALLASRRSDHDEVVRLLTPVVDRLWLDELEALDRAETACGVEPGRAGAARDSVLAALTSLRAACPGGARQTLSP